MLPKIRLLSFYFLLFSLISMFQTVSGQEWVWAVNGTGDNQPDNADRDIAVDRNGTQFIAGYFTNTMVLGSFTLVNPDDYYSDMYLAKVDATGNVIWAKCFDLGSTYNESMSICLDDQDNIFLTGANEGRIFVNKYSANGDLIWKSDISKKQYGGYGSDIAIDQYENVYVTGKEYGNAIVAKINSEGKWQWSSFIQSCNSNGCWGSDIAVDKFGNCYMAGGFDCDSIAIGDTVFKRYGAFGANPILVKYSSSGVVSWARCPVGTTVPRLEVALSDQNEVMLAGLYNSGQLVFNNLVTLPGFGSYGTGFLAKYTSDGGITWAKNSPVYESISKDIVMDYGGNIYWGGISWVNSAMAFHMIKFNANGDTVYTTPVIGNHQYIYGVDIDNSGYTYLTGYSGVKDLGVLGLGYINPATAYVAKFNTGAATTRRPASPFIQRIIPICPGSTTVPLLTATGSNVKWYSDDSLIHLVASGNSYQPVINLTDTFYVTQNVNGINSWPKQVIVYFSQVQDFQIQVKGDSLLAPLSSNYTYQWFYDGVAIDEDHGGQQAGINVNEIGKYKVFVNDFGCTKEASYFYYADKCPGRTANLVSNKKGFYYYWQVSIDNGLSFQNVSGNQYGGINKDTLLIYNVPSSYRSYKYRCVANFSDFSDTLEIPFQSKWIGGADNSFENPVNWSCGVVPDMYTDILIDSGTVIINSNTTVNSLRLNPSAVLTVSTGFNLTVLH